MSWNFEFGNNQMKQDMHHHKNNVKIYDVETSDEYVSIDIFTDKQLHVVCFMMQDISLWLQYKSYLDTTKEL